MGVIRLMMAMMVFASHELFFKTLLFKNSMFPLLLGMFLISFSFIETGYIVAKQIELNKYKNIRGFYFARLNRLLLPCLSMLFLSAIFLNEPQHAQKYNVVISEMFMNLNITDKLIYFFSNLFLQQDFISLMSLVDNKLVFDPLKTTGGLDGLIILSAPHYWSCGGDFIFMILFPLFLFNKQMKLFTLLILSFGVFQWYINYRFGFVTENNSDFILFWQHYPNIIFSIGIGYFFGSTKLNFNPLRKMEPIKQAITAFVIFFINVGILLVTYYYQLNYFILYLIILFNSALICDLLWSYFFNKKYDLKARDVATYLYVGQYLIYAVIYSFMEPGTYTMIIALVFGLICAYFISSFLEKHNARFIKYLNKKFNSETVKNV